MARVTDEDCIEKIPSKFDLIFLASYRARQLASGTPATVEINNDKHTVVSLREIAEGTIDVDDLREQAIEHYQHTIEVDEPEEDDMAKQMGVSDIDSDDGPDDEMLEEQILKALREGLSEEE